MTKLNTFTGFAIAIAIVAQSNSSLFAQGTVEVKVVNESEHPVTLKIVDVDLEAVPPTVSQRELGSVDRVTKKGGRDEATTKSMQIEKNANVSYFQNGKRIGDAQAKTGQKIFIRKSGIEFKLTEIFCHIADDEGSSTFGDEIEFHGKLKVDVIYYDANNQKHEVPRDPVKIYVEGLDDNSSRPLSNVWSIAIPADYLESAQVKLTWSETWEEDNASSSADDILQVDGGAERTLTKIRSEGPFKSHFRIRNAAKDADVSVKYECKEIETFEAK